VFRALFKRNKARHPFFKSKHPIRRAAVMLAGVAALYIITSAVLGISGAVPTAPVFFGLDADNYYFWQMVFILPLAFVVWGLAAGVLLATGKNGCARGAVLAEAALAWGVPLFIAWVPSAVQAAFMALGMGQEEWVGILSEPGVWQAVYLGFFLVAGVWAVGDFIWAGRNVHKKSWTAAVLTGAVAFVIAAGAYVALVR